MSEYFLEFILQTLYIQSKSQPHTLNDLTMSRQRPFLLLVFMLISVTVLSQEYYVVIGAFAKESNAEKFTGYANSKFLDAIYRKKVESNLFYVVVLETTSKEEAITRTKLLRDETEFKDAWFYFGHLEHLEPVVVATPPPTEIIATPAL